MKIRALGVALALALIPLSLAPAIAQYEEIVDRARQAVVHIVIESSRGRAAGSGFLIHPTGYVLTARHVVEDATRITVQVPDGRPAPAVVVRYSTAFDAAVLKINGTDLPTLSLGDSDAVRQGQEILVLGYPLATALGVESITVTKGIVSAVRSAQGLIQIDAALNPGSSGGPVLNLQGEVIAIAVAGVRGGQLLNLAVAINLARTLTADLSPTAIQPPARTTPPSAGAPPPSPLPAPGRPTDLPPAFGGYQIDASLAQAHQPQLESLTSALSSWNAARRPLEEGRFVDVQGMPGALDLLRRAWTALETRQPDLSRQLGDQIGQLQPQTVIVGIDGQRWVGVGFLYTRGSWNGIRFSKAERVRQNFELVASRLLGLLNQGPKSPQLAGIVLHYAYVYYTSTGRPQTHYGEEVQFRMPQQYVDQFLAQRITVDQFSGATTMIVKSQEDQVPQRLQIGTPPPQTPQPTQPAQPVQPVQPTQRIQPSPAPTPAAPIQPPATSQGAQQLPVRAIREISGGRESGALVIGETVVLRITTPFEGRSEFQRVEMLVERLNRLLSQALRPDEVKTGVLSGRHVILARDEILITIDDELARHNNMSPQTLAATWTKRIQDALGQLR